VAIGCFHHTGNVQRCIDEAHRVLKPGGSLLFMVYNKFSLRRWWRWPRATFKEWIAQNGWPAAPAPASAQQRGVYDHNAEGAPAPETVFLSVRELRAMLGKFGSLHCAKQNCDPLTVGRRVIPRRYLLSSLGRNLGLDLYVKAVKAADRLRIMPDQHPATEQRPVACCAAPGLRGLSLAEGNGGEQ
jgi:SAM-dependent methyltransferase